MGQRRGERRERGGERGQRGGGWRTGRCVSNLIAVLKHERELLFTVQHIKEPVHTYTYI